MTSIHDKNDKQVTEEKVLEDIHQTIADVAEKYVNNLQNEQAIRKDIINNTLHQLHDIQKDKKTMDTILETVHENRMQQIDNGESNLEKALSTGNIADIENALKNLMK